METGKKGEGCWHAVTLDPSNLAKEVNISLPEYLSDKGKVVELPTSVLWKVISRWLALFLGFLLLGLALGAAVLSFAGRGTGTHILLGRLVPEEVSGGAPPLKATNRVYRYHVLSNGLPALLCSDPSTETASAAMSVGVGYDHDPRDTMGLAHLLEHMLFQGSKKFPSSNEYKAFISGHGGSTNAATGNEDTTYYFTVQPGSLEPALDRFSQFFIAPTFNSSSIDSSIAAVNNEFLKALQGDGYRLNQLACELSANDSAYHSFGCGNTQTLTKPDIRDRLLKFYSTYYITASRMRLVMLSSHSLDVLQGMAETYFTAIPAGNSTAAVKTTPYRLFRSPVGAWDEPFPPSLTGRWITVQSVTDMRSLLFEFPLKPLLSRYRAQVEELLTYLVGTKYPKSLYSVLKEQCLITDLKLDFTDLTYFTMFKVTFQLTEAGMNNITEVSRRFFEFVDLIHRSPEQCRSSWMDMVALDNLTFAYAESPALSTFMRETAKAMQTKTTVEDLLGSPKNFAFDAQLLEETLLQLTPRNLLLYVVSKQPNIPLPLIEPFFNVSYENQPIPAELIAAWSSVTAGPEMAFPPSNQYLPTNLTVLPLWPNGSAPVELLAGSEAALWYGRSTQFALPKAYFQCVWDTAEVPRNSTTAALADIFTMVANDALEESTALASLAGMSYSFAPTSTGLSLGVSGYSDSLQTLLATALQTITGGSGGVPAEGFSQARLDVLVEKYQQDLYNADFSTPSVDLKSYYAKLLTRTPTYNRTDLHSAAALAQPLTVAQLQRFVKEVVYPSVRVECMAFGNLLSEQALAMTKAVVDGLGYSSAKAPAEPEELKAVLLSDSSTAFTIPAPNPDELNSGLLATFQLAPVAPASQLTAQKAAALNLLYNIMSQRCFDQLRTIEKLGYVAKCLTNAVRSRSYSTSYLHVLVQSGTYSAAHLDSRAMNFLHNYVSELQELSEKEFATSRKSLVATVLEKASTLASEVSTLWTEISQHTYAFSESKIEAQAVESLTRLDLQEMLNQTMLDSGRRRASMWFIGKGKAVPISPEPDEIDPPQVILPFSKLAEWKAAQATL